MFIADLEINQNLVFIVTGVTVYCMSTHAGAVTVFFELLEQGAVHIVAILQCKNYLLL